jgi:hypothetical protein
MKQLFRFKLEDGTIVTGANPVEALMQVKASTTGKAFDEKFKKEEKEKGRKEALVEFNRLRDEYIQLKKQILGEEKVEKTPDVIAEEEKVNFDNETKIGGLFYDNLDSNAKEEFIKNKSRQNRDAFASQAEFIENYEKTRNRMKEVIDRNGDKEELLLVWGIHPSYLDSIKDKPEEIENSYKKALEEYGLNR